MKQVICFKCCKTKHKSSNYVSITVLKNVKNKVRIIIMRRIKERNEYKRNFN